MRKISFNMFMSVIARIVIIVTGIIVQRYILVAFGSLYNGLTSSISQVMNYLALLEAGLGAASIQALYQPIAGKNWKEVSGIFTATEKEYQKITAVFLSLLIAVSFLLPVFVAEEIDFRISAFLTFLTGLSSIMSYIVGGKYKSVLAADQKMYVLYILDIVSVTLSCVFRIIALKSGYSIIIVQAINLLTVGIKNFGYQIYVKKKYHQIYPKEIPAFHLISKRWNVLVHSLSGMVVTNTDVLILTVFSSLKVVSVYSVFNMIFGQVSSFLTSTFSQAALPTFGILFYNDFEKFRTRFHQYEYVYTIILFLVGTFFTVVALPFVAIYTKGVTDTNYLDPVLPVLFGIILLMNQVRTPAIIAINASGTFKETQTGAIIEAVINILVSLVLYFATPLGLYGLLLGTVCSYIYRTTNVLIYCYKDILKEKMLGIVKLIAVNAITAVGFYCVYTTFVKFEGANLIEFLIYAIIVFVSLTVLFLAANVLFNKKAFIELLDLLSSLFKGKR